MGCSGIGLGRLMGTSAEVFHDERGLIWPEAIAPAQIHLILLARDPALAKKAEELYNVLTKERFEVLYDDRDLSAGAKLMDSDLIGLPFRLITSEKTKLKGGLGVEVKLRSKPETKIIPLSQIITWLKNQIKI